MMRRAWRPVLAPALLVWVMASVLTAVLHGLEAAALLRAALARSAHGSSDLWIGHQGEPILAGGH